MIYDILSITSRMAFVQWNVTESNYNLIKTLTMNFPLCEVLPTRY
jgi:hypothetical protein